MTDDSSQEEDFTEVVQEKLAEGLTISGAAGHLIGEYGITENAAMAIVTDVVVKWASEDKQFSPYARAMQRRRLMNMKESAAMKEQVAIEKQIKELDDAQGHKSDEDEVDLAELIANKTDEEVDYYTENGHWPDEAPKVRELPNQGQESDPEISSG